MSVLMTERRVNCAVLIIDGNRTLLRELQRGEESTFAIFLTHGSQLCSRKCQRNVIFFQVNDTGKDTELFFV